MHQGGGHEWMFCGKRRTIDVESLAQAGFGCEVVSGIQVHQREIDEIVSNVDMFSAACFAVRSDRGAQEFFSSREIAATMQESCKITERVQSVWMRISIDTTQQLD